jgi:hypothetical protein
MRWICLLMHCLLPAAEFDVTRYGARADGKTDSTAAIQAAIVAAGEAGGGQVVFPAAALPYLVKETIAVRRNGVEITGSGARLRLADRVIQSVVKPLLLFEGKQSQMLKGAVLRGLTIEANYFEQGGKTRSKAVVLKFVEGARVEDVEIVQAYVGLSIRRSVNVEARRVTVRDYEEDAFDAGGDADEVPGGTARNIRFIEVVARDAERGARDGNAFEIEDGAQGVLIENSLVENVSGNGVGLRNHKSEGNHSANVELRNIVFRKIGGEFAVFGRCAASEMSARNSYRGIRLNGISATDSAVAMAGPIAGLEIVNSQIGSLHLGFQQADEPALIGNALLEGKVQGVTVERLRVNGASKSILVTGSKIGVMEQLQAN